MPCTHVVCRTPSTPFSLYYERNIIVFTWKSSPSLFSKIAMYIYATLLNITIAICNIMQYNIFIF